MRMDAVGAAGSFITNAPPITIVAADIDHDGRSELECTIMSLPYEALPHDFISITARDL